MISTYHKLAFFQQRNLRTRFISPKDIFCGFWGNFHRPLPTITKLWQYFDIFRKVYQPENWLCTKHSFSLNLPQKKKYQQAYMTFINKIIQHTRWNLLSYYLWPGCALAWSFPAHWSYLGSTHQEGLLCRWDVKHFSVGRPAFFWGGANIFWGVLHFSGVVHC